MRDITITEFRSLLEKNNPRDAFIDVRSRAEYDEEHIANVTNIPLDEIMQHIKRLASCDAIYIQCRSGGRSAYACSALASENIMQTVNVAGGILAWKRQGYPTVSEKPRPTTV